MIITTDCVHQLPDFLCLRCHPELRFNPIKDNWPTSRQSQARFEPIRKSEFVLPPEKEKPTKRKEYVKQDLTGMRWCPRRNKFVKDTFTKTATSQEEDTTMKKKWKITCYNSANEVIERGSSSVPEDTGQVELFTKMGAAYHRCAAGSVHKIIVTNDIDEQVRVWEQGQNAEFPKPDPKAAKPAAPPPRVADKEKPAAKKAAKEKPKAAAKAKNGKGAKEQSKAKGGEKGGAIKKVGVIDTIVATMRGKDGASISEIVEVLKKKFPDRDEKGMTATARIQANKNCSHKEKDDVRGMLYFAEK